MYNRHKQLTIYKAQWKIYDPKENKGKFATKIDIIVTCFYCSLIFRYRTHTNSLTFSIENKQITQSVLYKEQCSNNQNMVYTNKSILDLIDMTTGISYLFTRIIPYVFYEDISLDLFLLHKKRSSFLNCTFPSLLLSKKNRILEYKFSYDLASIYFIPKFESCAVILPLPGFAETQAHFG